MTTADTAMNIKADPPDAADSVSSSQANREGAGAHLRVRVDDRELRLPLAALAGVADCPPLARVPAAPPWLLGVGGLHGRLLPVVDLAAAETNAVAASAPGPRVLLVEVCGHVMGFSVSDVSVEPDDSPPADAPDIAIHELAARLLKNAFVPPGNDGQTG